MLVDGLGGVRKRAVVALAAQAWEQQRGTQVPVVFRPKAAAVVLTGPPELFETLAEDEAVAALDVEAA